MFSDKFELISFLKKKKIRNLFVICGKNSFKNSGAINLFSSIFKSIKVTYYFKKKKVPELNELKSIIKIIKKKKPDMILAIGGGSVIDYAKMASVVDIKKNTEQLIKDYSYSTFKKKTKLVVVPTTAGSGAEVTSNAVIYINKIKYSFENELLIPDYYFLIPELINTSPFEVKSSAGFDAIAQSIESLISKKSNSESVNYATKSLNISLKYFLDFLKKPNLSNAGKMSVAANLAGKAINISKTTAPHALSYPFSSHFNLSHGHAVSLFFEKILKFNFDNRKYSSSNFDLIKRFEILFKIFNVNNLSELNSKISNIKRKAKLIDNLKILKIDIKKDTNKIIKGVNLLRLSNNPVRIDQNILIDIISNQK